MNKILAAAALLMLSATALRAQKQDTLIVINPRKPNIKSGVQVTAGDSLYVQCSGVYSCGSPLEEILDHRRSNPTGFGADITEQYKQHLKYQTLAAGQPVLGAMVMFIQNAEEKKSL